jgi:hypothetical protein
MSFPAQGVASVRQRMQRIPGPLLDAGLALVVAAAILVAIGVAPQPGRRPDALAYLLGLTIAGLVLARRRWPVAVLVASFAAMAVYYLRGYVGISAAVPLAVALYTAGAAGHLRWALLVAAVVVGGAAVGGAGHRLGRRPSPLVTGYSGLVRGRTAPVPDPGRARTAPSGPR